MSTQAVTVSPKLIGYKGFGDLMAVGESTIRRLRDKGELPKQVPCGGSVRWLRSEVEAWIDAGCPKLRDWELMKEDGLKW